MQTQELENPRASVSSDGASQRRPSSGTGAVLPVTLQRGQQREVLASSRARDEELWQAYEEQGTVLEETKAKLKLALEEKEEIHNEWRQATRDLNRLQADRNYKVDDDYLLAAWKELCYEVKNWAIQHFDGEIRSQVFRIATNDQLNKLTSDAKYWLRSARLRPVIVQAYVWKFLCFHVFETRAYTRGLIWAGLSNLQLRALGSILTPKSRPGRDHATDSNWKEFHRWRALTAGLLEPQVHEQEPEDRARTLVRLIDDVLHSYVSSRTQTYKDGIWRIITRAARMDAELQKQRAAFEVWAPVSLARNLPYGFPPDLNYCESHDDFQPLIQNAPIQLIVVPALLKYGTSDGEHYDKCIYLAKSRVTQDTHETVSHNTNSLSAQGDNVSTYNVSPRPSFQSHPTSQRSPDNASMMTAKRQRTGSTFGKAVRGFGQEIKEAFQAPPLPPPKDQKPGQSAVQTGASQAIIPRR